MEKFRYTNELINETSPYLLQHAHNPVEWHGWNENTLQIARSQDKLLLISIGYAACHWCHVMEHESFEDLEVAEIMNRDFICIKVDREERPDIDQVYMNAVQLITGSGGWPLNCFALPNGHPFYGGTYFRKKEWIDLLRIISRLYSSKREELVKQAEMLVSGVRETGKIGTKAESNAIKPDFINQAYDHLQKNFDRYYGGLTGAPKFPLPVVTEFLLRYHYFNPSERLLDYLKLTLNKMAFGGIYDQVGGGFARYSTDSQWKVPHFEKMLYDNAQLVSLYAEAYKKFKKPLYRDVIIQTLEFVSREMTGKSGEFFSSIDADSEGEEGRYYIWNNHEFKSAIGAEANMVAEYFHIGTEALWEQDKNVLLRSATPDEFARQHKLDPDVFKTMLKESLDKLKKERLRRVLPARDDKTLTSWNALMSEAYIDAYKVLGKKGYLDAALRNVDFILSNLKRDEGGLFHSWKEGKSQINGFLEDYSFMIGSLVSLYEVTFEEKRLQQAAHLAEYALSHFYDNDSGLFFFTSDKDSPLIARKFEVHDGVIPSSNAAMAHNLFRLYQITERHDFRDISEKMMGIMQGEIIHHPAGYAHWASLALNMAYPYFTIVITGKESQKVMKAIHKHYYPGMILAGSAGNSSLPVFKGRFVDGKTMIFVCTGSECRLPTTDIGAALKMLQ